MDKCLMANKQMLRTKNRCHYLYSNLLGIERKMQRSPHRTRLFVTPASHMSTEECVLGKTLAISSKLQGAHSYLLSTHCGHVTLCLSTQSDNPLTPSYPNPTILSTLQASTIGIQTAPLIRALDPRLMFPTHQANFKHYLSWYFVITNSYFIQQFIKPNFNVYNNKLF